MGSDLQIVDVGNNILQFKFGSEYQLKWVEQIGLGILIIICCCCVDGEEGFQLQISSSLIPLFVFKFGDFPLSSFQRRLAESSGIALEDLLKWMDKQGSPNKPNS